METGLIASSENASWRNRKEMTGECRNECDHKIDDLGSALASISTWTLLSGLPEKCFSGPDFH